MVIGGREMRQKRSNLVIFCVCQARQNRGHVVVVRSCKRGIVIIVKW